MVRSVCHPPFAKSREGWGTHCVICHRKAGPPARYLQIYLVRPGSAFTRGFPRTIELPNGLLMDGFVVDLCCPGRLTRLLLCIATGAVVSRHPSLSVGFVPHGTKRIAWKSPLGSIPLAVISPRSLIVWPSVIVRSESGGTNAFRSIIEPPGCQRKPCSSCSTQSS